MFKTMAFLIIFILAFSKVKQGENDWQLKVNKNGIAVYTRQVPGTNIKAIKSVFIMNTSLSGLVALLADISSYHKWVYRCSNAEILKTISPTELIYYQETSVPWPASNRDFVGKLKISQDPNTHVVTITIENMPDYIPVKSGKVRLKKYHDVSIIVPKGNGKAELTYELMLDPGGNIPAWMVNLAISEGPYQSNTAMIKLINSGVYKNARFAFIKEP